MKISELTEQTTVEGVRDFFPVIRSGIVGNSKMSLATLRNWVLSSPILTGSPTAESTPDTSDNSLKLATTAFVKNVIADGSSFITSLMNKVRAAAFGQGSVIQRNADLNDYTAVGRYCCKDNDIPATVTNRPTANTHRFELIVEVIGPSSCIKQTYKESGLADVSYTRSYYQGDGWGSWSRIATTYDSSYIVKRYRYVYTGWAPGPHRVKANDFEVYNGSTWESGGISTPKGYYPAAIRQLSPGDEGVNGDSGGYVVPQAFSLNAGGTSNAFSFFNLRSGGTSVADYVRGTVTIDILYLPLSSKIELTMASGSITPVTPSVGG